jgi:hypothetical protein
LLLGCLDVCLLLFCSHHCAAGTQHFLLGLTVCKAVCSSTTCRWVVGQPSVMRPAGAVASCMFVLSCYPYTGLLTLAGSVTQLLASLLLCTSVVALTAYPCQAASTKHA